MNPDQYSTLLEALASVPDPRKTRGKRHSWLMLLTLLAAGLASRHQTVHAIAQWVALKATDLQSTLPGLTRLPSEAPLLRTLRLIDVTILENAIAHLTQSHTPTQSAGLLVVTPCGTLLQAQALDGKTLRGATACGTATHLVSLVQHGSGVTLAQGTVAAKRNELSAAPTVLRDRDLTDTLITTDALHTQRAFAQLIDTARGYYFMMVSAISLRCMTLSP